jgi:hypothetical protein
MPAEVLEASAAAEVCLTITSAYGQWGHSPCVEGCARPHRPAPATPPPMASLACKHTTPSADDLLPRCALRHLQSELPHSMAHHSRGSGMPPGMSMQSEVYASRTQPAPSNIRTMQGPQVRHSPGEALRAEHLAALDSTGSTWQHLTALVAPGSTGSTWQHLTALAALAALGAGRLARSGAARGIAPAGLGGAGGVMRGVAASVLHSMCSSRRARRGSSATAGG